MLNISFTHGTGTGYDTVDKQTNGALTSALNYVANVYDNLFTNNVTIKIRVNFTDLGGANSAGSVAIAQNDLGGWENGLFGYQRVRSALIGHETSLLQQSAYSNLPGTDPTGTNKFSLTVAEAEALGLESATETDALLQFNTNSAVAFSYNTGAPAATAFSFIAVAEHEISEIMGRDGLVGTQSLLGKGQNPSGFDTPLDLFRYSGPPSTTNPNGVRELATSGAGGPATGYFSPDKGVTNWGGGFFNNTVSNGDLSDYVSGGDVVPNDAFGYGNGGTAAPLSLQDIYLMNVLGWTLATPPQTVPNGVTDWVGPSTVSGIPTAQLGNDMTVMSGGTLDVAAGGGTPFRPVAGGTASGTIVQRAGTLNVAAGRHFYLGRLPLFTGGTAIDTTIQGGGTENVSGIDIGAKISGGGQHIDPGGVASAAIINGGTQYVSSGGTASGTTISGSTEWVYSGGIAEGTTISGGIAIVEGSATDAVIHTRGGLFVEAGGTASGSKVSGGVLGVQDDHSTVSGTTVFAGGRLNVSAGDYVQRGLLKLWVGPTAVDTTISAGGRENVTGHDVRAKVYGEQDVLMSGVAISATLLAGGTQFVSAGGLALATNDSGGNQTISAGGTAIAPTISGGIQIVRGTATDTTLTSGTSWLWGSATSTTIDSGGTEYVERGGRASGTIVHGGGQDIVYAGGTTSHGAVNGGTQHVYGSATSMTVMNTAVVANGGVENVEFGGVATGNVLSNGGVQNVAGQASGTTVGDFASELVKSGGVATSSTVDLGGLQVVSAGGTTVGTQVEAAGRQDVYGVASGTILSTGGFQNVYGSAIGGAVDGYQYVYGSVSSMAVGPGGQEEVWAGGVATGNTVSNGGRQDVYGSATNTTLAAGGEQFVGFHGVASGTVVSAGGYIGVMDDGFATGCVVSSGGVVDDFGITLGMVVSGTENVHYATLANVTTIASGGVENIYAGSLDYSATVSRGGVQYDSGYSNHAVLEGGTQDVYGSAVFTKVDSGGTENVLSGGVATSATVDAGGSEIAHAGATISGATLSGGTLDMQSGATAGSSTITFDGGGTLKIDGTGSNNFLVAGFAAPDAFDLSAVNFASASKSYSGNTSSGTLTVTDGTNSVSIQLLGNYMASSFALGQESGGGTGTIVTDPPLAASGSQSFLAHPSR